MKFNIKYIYMILILIVAAIIVISSISTEPVTRETSLPSDEIHQSMGGTLGGDPGKGNVSSEFKHQMEMYKKEVDENPGDTLKVREYAELLSAAHKPEEGNKYFKKILDVDPGRIDVMTNLVFNYFNMRKLDKAEIYNESILKIDPTDKNAIYNKGVIEATRGNTTEAKKHWERVIKLAPGSNVADMAQSNLNKLSNAK